MFGARPVATSSMLGREIRRFLALGPDVERHAGLRRP